MIDVFQISAGRNMAQMQMIKIYTEAIELDDIFTSAIEFQLHEGQEGTETHSGISVEQDFDQTT